MKRLRFFTLVGILLLGITIVVHAVDDGDDDWLFEDFDLEEIEDEPFALRSIDPRIIIACTLQNIVKKPLWDHTSIPKGRDVLYLMPYKIATLERGGLAATAFFNMTDRMNVTLGDVFNAEGINVALEGLVNLLADSAAAGEVTRLTPFLRRMTIQDRKAGVLLQAGLTRGPFVFELNTSIFLSERNFWLSNKDRNAIKNIILRNFPDAEQLDEEEFYQMNFGPGDTRLKLGLNLVNRELFQADIGFEGIIPTSQIAASNNTVGEPVVDDEEDAVRSEFTRMVGNLLARSQELILSPRLGNMGHFGLGIYFESKANLFNNAVHIWHRLSYTNFFPAWEDRLILQKITMAPQDVNAQNLGVFAQQYLFPTAHSVEVQPGAIVNLVAGADIEQGPYRFSLGYDYYLQRAERFNHVHDVGDTDSLMIENATAPRAQQHKIFTETTMTKKCSTLELQAGFGGDVTVDSKGLGRDWTVYIKFGFSF